MKCNACLSTDPGVQGWHNMNLLCCCVRYIAALPRKSMQGQEAKYWAKQSRGEFSAEQIIAEVKQGRAK